MFTFTFRQVVVKKSVFKVLLMCGTETASEKELYNNK